MSDSDRGSLPVRPSILAVDRATKQLSIERVLSQWAAVHEDASATPRALIVLNFPTKGKS